MGQLHGPSELHLPHHLQLSASAANMGRRGKSPPARLTVHQGRGLTPHQTWPPRARRSGPSSLLQLKGEEREINGEDQHDPCALTESLQVPAQLLANHSPNTHGGHETPHPPCTNPNPPTPCQWMENCWNCPLGVPGCTRSKGKSYLWSQRLELSHQPHCPAWGRLPQTLS